MNRGSEREAVALLVVIVCIMLYGSFEGGRGWPTLYMPRKANLGVEQQDYSMFTGTLLFGLLC